jgi:hypothetical protein
MGAAAAAPISLLRVNCKKSIQILPPKEYSLIPNNLCPNR